MIERDYVKLNLIKVPNTMPTPWPREWLPFNFVNPQESDMTDNMEARMKRIETALYLLCRHLGLDPRTGDRLTDNAPHNSTPKDSLKKVHANESGAL